MTFFFNDLLSLWGREDARILVNWYLPWPDTCFLCNKARMGTCFGNNSFSFYGCIIYQEVSECYCWYCNKKLVLMFFKIGMELMHFLIGRFTVSMCLKCACFRLKQLHLLLFYILFLYEFYKNLQITVVHNAAEKEVIFIDFILLTGH